MKRFNNIDDLHAYIERQADRTIKFYYTDFKNYDRPEIMRATGAREKETYLIMRESGSYFYTADEITNPAREFPAVVMDYYTSDKTARYFRIDFNKLTVEKIAPGLPQHLKRIRNELQKTA